MEEIKLITTGEMQDTIKEYFKDFFEDITFRKSLDYIGPNEIYVMTAYRHQCKIEYDFDLEKWSRDVFFNMQFHRLENIKGRFTKYLDTIYTA